jgi:hypothetical protein
MIQNLIHHFLYALYEIFYILVFRHDKLAYRRTFYTAFEVPKLMIDWT